LRAPSHRKIASAAPSRPRAASGSPFRTCISPYTDGCPSVFPRTGQAGYACHKRRTT
jgi:hypothetical protein